MLPSGFAGLWFIAISFSGYVLMLHLMYWKKRDSFSLQRICFLKRVTWCFFLAVFIGNWFVWFKLKLHLASTCFLVFMAPPEVPHRPPPLWSALLGSIYLFFCCFHAIGFPPHRKYNKPVLCNRIHGEYSGCWSEKPCCRVQYNTVNLSGQFKSS